MPLLAGFDREAWSPFVFRGLQRYADAEPDRQKRRERRGLLDRLRGDRDLRDMVVTLAVLEYAADEPPPVDPPRKGDLLIRLLDWFEEHKEFIEWLIGLFAGLSGAGLAPDAT